MDILWSGKGSLEQPWVLRTPSLGSTFTMFRDDTAQPPLLVCDVGTTRLTYLARVIEDMHAMLVAHGDWMLLGASDEKKPPKEGTVEAWGRCPDNPVGGWYGQRKGYRGRVGHYIPPLLEALGLVELEHKKRNSRIRAIEVSS